MSPQQEDVPLPGSQQDARVKHKQCKPGVNVDINCRAYSFHNSLITHSHVNMRGVSFYFLLNKSEFQFSKLLLLLLIDV